MYVISGIFVILTILFLLLRKQTQKVKQFNIFYSGEAPSRPELSHFSYNFFAHYRKAVGALALPLVSGFWDRVTEIIHAVSDFIRRIYTGNGQTYLFHIVLYVVVVFPCTIRRLSMSWTLRNTLCTADSLHRHEYRAAAERRHPQDLRPGQQEGGNTLLSAVYRSGEELFADESGHSRCDVLSWTDLPSDKRSGTDSVHPSDLRVTGFQ